MSKSNVYTLQPSFFTCFGAAMHHIERALHARASGDMTFLDVDIRTVRRELESAYDLLPEPGRNEVARVLDRLGTSKYSPAPEKKAVKGDD